MPATVRGRRNHAECEALLIDQASRTYTYPAIQVRGPDNIAQHEASVSRLDEEQIFYMRLATPSASRSNRGVVIFWKNPAFQAHPEMPTSSLS